MRLCKHRRRFYLCLFRFYLFTVTLSHRRKSLMTSIRARRAIHLYDKHLGGSMPRCLDRETMHTGIGHAPPVTVTTEQPSCSNPTVAVQ